MTIWLQIEIFHTYRILNVVGISKKLEQSPALNSHINEISSRIFYQILKCLELISYKMYLLELNYGKKIPRDRPPGMIILTFI